MYNGTSLTVWWQNVLCMSFTQFSRTRGDVRMPFPRAYCWVQSQLSFLEPALLEVSCWPLDLCIFSQRQLRILAMRAWACLQSSHGHMYSVGPLSCLPSWGSTSCASWSAGILSLLYKGWKWHVQCNSLNSYAVQWIFLVNLRHTKRIFKLSSIRCLRSLFCIKNQRKFSCKNYSKLRVYGNSGWHKLRGRILEVCPIGCPKYAHVQLTSSHRLLCLWSYDDLSWFGTKTKVLI